MTTNTTQCVDKLNMLLKGELSALETYRQALEKTTDPAVKKVLASNHVCHSGRVDTLVLKIKEYGGKPAENSGAWGAFVKLIEGGATVFGDKASVAVLEEGEDHGMEDYQKCLKDADPNVTSVASALMPKQEGTHAAMKALKESLQ